MDDSHYLAAIRGDGTAFASAVRAAGLDTPVPSCPGWGVADLLWHLAAVHTAWATVVELRALDRSQVDWPVRPTDDQLLAAYDAGLERLLDTLSSTAASTPVWTWSDDHTVGFVTRRMAHETAVHRWDAQLAAGDPADIEAELASDGIDEFLMHFFGAPSGTPALIGSVHIHCGDAGGEWTVRPDSSDAGFTVTREHAKGDCALRGRASDLVLALWRRVGIDSIDVVGDASVAAHFLAASPLE